MDTVATETTERPAVDLCSTDYYVDLMRRQLKYWTDIELLAMAYIKVVAKQDYPDTGDEIHRVRAILAAVEIVRAELAHADVTTTEQYLAVER